VGKNGRFSFFWRLKTIFNLACYYITLPMDTKARFVPVGAHESQLGIVQGLVKRLASGSSSSSSSVDVTVETKPVFDAIKSAAARETAPAGVIVADAQATAGTSMADAVWMMATSPAPRPVTPEQPSPATKRQRKTPRAPRKPVARSLLTSDESDESEGESLSATFHADLADLRAGRGDRYIEELSSGSE